MSRFGANCLSLVVLGGLLGMANRSLAEEYLSGKVWPEPRIVAPGEAGGPPADAIVLFDGRDLSQWDGGEKWKIDGGVATVGGGTIRSKQAFGDCQLHVEWSAPGEVKGEGQERGNSGVYLLGRYEVQILDSYRNQTYPDGSAAAIYKQAPPLVNASRGPGEWQEYEIIFLGPRFDAEGKLTRPAFVTVLHNGVLVQNHAQLEGSTAWDKAPQYEPHPEKAPLVLQDHGNPVRFRNIWIREL